MDRNRKALPYQKGQNKLSYIADETIKSCKNWRFAASFQPKHKNRKLQKWNMLIFEELFSRNQ